MRILVLSKEGDGLGVAQRLAMEGHSVDLWIQKNRFDRSGEGIVNRVPTWRTSIAKADLVICDMVGFGGKEELFKKMGKPVLCCNKAVETVELNRRLGMQLFEKAGISIPPTYTFAHASEAKDLPSKVDWGHGLVIKPDGNLDTSTTMVVKEKDEWGYCLEKIPGAVPTIVQEVVEGVEVSTEGWFNGRDFVRPFNHTFEEKRFLAGSLGQNTGCMGNVIVRTDSNKLTRATVERLKPFLSHVGYRGPIDVNCIVNQEAAFALESTSRLGYDAIEALLEGLDEPAGDFFFEVAVGIKREMDLTKDTMIAVRLSIPPWPMAKPKEDEFGEPVGGINEQSLKHIFITDMYVDKDGKYKTAGGDGVLLKATARGRVRENSDKTLDYTREAQRRVYRTLDNIKVSSKQYRTDIGDRVNGDIAKLKKWGWM